MNFQSLSQAGQDVFAMHCCKSPSSRTFLEIGSCEPFNTNNTAALEMAGWVGLCCDRSEDSAALFAKSERKSRFIHRDALEVDWHNELKGWPVNMAYLSLDVDENTPKAFARLPFDKHRFQCITVEHDAYRFGDVPRQEIRRILLANGYDIICRDVCGQPDVPFEEWAVDPAQVDMATIEPLRCEGAFWKDIIDKIP